MNFILTVLLSFVTIILSLTVIALDQHDDRVAVCARQSPDASRLTCYDELAARANRSVLSSR